MSGENLYRDFGEFELVSDGGTNRTRSEIVSEMQRIAPPGQDILEKPAIERLRSLTRGILAVNSSRIVSEHNRFNSVRDRGLELDDKRVLQFIKGKNILVTGGTGCIGASLISDLAQFEPNRLVSLSRGQTLTQTQHEEAEYIFSDIRDRDSLGRILKTVAPDIVYHLAAQHDPSLAETEVARTLSTNVEGTRNIIDLSRSLGIPQIVFASTGKALRFYTSDTYAGSKKVGEYLMAKASEGGDILCSGVRFTHIVDNSIIYRRIQEWIDKDQPIRLHGPDIMFYLQSAKEASHLLLNSGLEATPREFQVQAIRDLGWPINLVDLAIGSIAETGSNTPVYFCGFESGYEEKSHPALYDPIYAGELSPLINALEAPEAVTSIGCSQVDRFNFTVHSSNDVRQRLGNLASMCIEGASNKKLHDVKNEILWTILDARLKRLSPEILQRTARRMRELSEYCSMNEEHSRTNGAVYTELQARS